MTATLAHVSDLHFGAETPEIVEALVGALDEVNSSIVVVSGDLTQRARTKQFEAARRFLDRIRAPTVVVPGNHDIPLFDVFRRFVAPLARYKRHIATDVDPFLAVGRVAVLGLNTARSNTWKDGRLSPGQIDAIRARFRTLPEETVKVLVTHHPFLPPPGDPSPPLVGHASEALAAAEASGVDLVLAGHLHHGYIGEIRTHHTNIRRSILVAQAGTATSHRTRTEPNSFNVIVIEPHQIAFSLRVWDGEAFRETRVTEYVKAGADWVPADRSARQDHQTG
jgi:3',5'-cyclic AMP phosphodiesterase CpdA